MAGTGEGGYNLGRTFQTADLELENLLDAPKEVPLFCLDLKDINNILMIKFPPWWVSDYLRELKAKHGDHVSYMQLKDFSEHHINTRNGCITKWCQDPTMLLCLILNTISWIIDVATWIPAFFSLAPIVEFNFDIFLCMMAKIIILNASISDKLSRIEKTHHIDWKIFLTEPNEIGWIIGLIALSMDIFYYYNEGHEKLYGRTLGGVQCILIGYGMCWRYFKDLHTPKWIVDAVHEILETKHTFKNIPKSNHKVTISYQELNHYLKVHLDEHKDIPHNMSILNQNIKQLFQRIEGHYSDGEIDEEQLVYKLKWTTVAKEFLFSNQVISWCIWLAGCISLVYTWPVPTEHWQTLVALDLIQYYGVAVFIVMTYYNTHKDLHELELMHHVIGDCFDTHNKFELKHFQEIELKYYEHLVDDQAKGCLSFFIADCCPLCFKRSSKNSHHLIKATAL